MGVDLLAIEYSGCCCEKHLEVVAETSSHLDDLCGVAVAIVVVIVVVVAVAGWCLIGWG